ncbi:MAG: HIT domain-containing protein [Campylobacterota bacterium]|nr:HIT domain-containing protein [Campylobacterota bacterium]
MEIFQNELIKIKLEPHNNPWLIIFTQRKIKEFSQASDEEKIEIFKYLDIIEKEMLSYFKPEKINIASFGNMLPHLHWHIQARFKDDEYFPNPLWGERQRDLHVEIKPIEFFIENLKNRL